MKCIIIDAKNREVREEEMNPPTLEFMQKAVEGYIERAVELDEVNEVYVNEEGLLEGIPYFFEIEGGHQPFAGNGIVVGHDDEGNTIGTTLKPSELKIKFMDIEEVRKKFA